jgi:nucleotide-binding universal stress UspA family protein
MGVIVVGVDGSETSNAALAWARVEGRMRGARLVLVHAWQPSTLEYGAMGVGAYELHEEAQRNTSARVFLEETVADVLGRDPGVDLELRVVKGSAAHALRDAAGGAELLVVGSRGHGGFTELLLGSVSHYLVYHASCPVVVVRGIPKAEEFAPILELHTSA